MASTVVPQETVAGSIHIEDPSIDYVDQTNLVYHKLCAAQSFEQGEGKPFHVNGTHLAVFRYFMLLTTVVRTWAIPCRKAVSETAY